MKAITTNTQVPIKDQINNGTFTGTFTIENLAGQYIEKWTCNNGVQTGHYVANPPVPRGHSCTLSTIHGCVAQSIADMGLFSYLGCCVTADYSYPALWADCIWSNCYH